MGKIYKIFNIFQSSHASIDFIWTFLYIKNFGIKFSLNETIIIWKFVENTMQIHALQQKKHGWNVLGGKVGKINRKNFNKRI